MSTAASALAQTLANHSDEDVLQAFQLFDSLRPNFRVNILALQEPLRRYDGVLGNINYDKGFGFIQSPEATADFGKDVFVSTNEVGDNARGSHINFTVIVNRNGQPQARLVQGRDGKVPQFLQGLYEQNHGIEQPAMKKPRFELPKGAMIAPARVVAPQAGAMIAPAGGRYVGHIAEFNPAKQFGFISSPQTSQEFGKDAFLSSMELGNFKVGDAVSFDVALNKNGQPQARNLQPSDGIMKQVSSPVVVQAKQIISPPAQFDLGGIGGAIPDDARFTGTITAFKPEKHFGFIMCPELKEQFGGKDIFVSDQEIKHFQIGSSVTFRVVMNAKGNPQARDLE